jgi:solute carrier family 31 (copper transporter), member 1
MAPQFDSASMRTGKCISVQMLWNWETIDNCLISRSWHIKSKAQFAGSCIGIVLLAMCVPLLHRLARIYDIKILREHQRRLEERRGHKLKDIDNKGQNTSGVSAKVTKLIRSASEPGRFRPTLVQQLLRAVLHLSQFIIAYFLMLYVAFLPKNDECKDI